MTVNIDAIVVGDRIRKEYSKIDELAADIAKNGLLNPITAMRVGEDDGEGLRLLAGLRRLKAAQSLGWTEIPVNIVTPSDAEQILAIEIAENEQRESFTCAEKAEYGRILEEIESAKAKGRMSLGGKGGLSEKDGVCTCPPLEVGKTRDIVGKKLGMSGRSYERLKHVVENAPLEVVEEIDNGKKTIGGAYKELKSQGKAAEPISEPDYEDVDVPTIDEPEIEVVEVKGPIDLKIPIPEIYMDEFQLRKYVNDELYGLNQQLIATLRQKTDEIFSLQSDKERLLRLYAGVERELETVKKRLEKYEPKEESA